MENKEINVKWVENVKVYRMDDCEWWASKWNEEETNKFFNEEYGTENEIEDVKECNMDKDGMWYTTNNPKDIEELGDNDEIMSIEKVNGMKKRKVAFGNLMRRDGEVFKYMSFRDVLKLNGDFENPFMIATTEW